MPSASKATSLAVAVAMVLASASPGAAQAAAAEARDALTRRLVSAAVARAQVKVRYLADYVRLPYPGGDVPADTGVCTDEIIRIYRAVGIDLQKEVHEDVVRSPSSYPRVRGHPDASIDHRRVPNLMAYFARHGEVLASSGDPGDYRPGDLVVWDLQAGHIGMVIDRKDASGVRPLILHNVGAGPRIEDALLAWRIIGHYHYPAGGAARPPDARRIGTSEAAPRAAAGRLSRARASPAPRPPPGAAPGTAAPSPAAGPAPPACPR